MSKANKENAAIADLIATFENMAPSAFSTLFKHDVWNDRPAPNIPAKWDPWLDLPPTNFKRSTI